MNPGLNKKTCVGKWNRFSVFRRQAALVFLLPFCFLAGAFMAARAAQPPAPLTLSSNRYLFIVDTSVSMQPRASNTLQMVVQLFMSDLNGNLRRGDTVGVWTFNEELYAGQFPLKVWSPGRRQTVAQQVIDFLRKQPLEKPPNLNAAIPEMLRVIKNSDDITVLLFSDGSSELHGTPFDDQINAVYWKQFLQMQKAAMPFVTVLRARGGVIESHSVSFAPWPVDIPALPTPSEPAQVAAEQPPPTNPPPAAISLTTNTAPLTELEKKVESTAEAPAAKPDVPAEAVAKPVALVPTVVAETPQKEPAEVTAAPPPVIAAVVEKTETPATAVPQTETKAVVETVEQKVKALIAESKPPAAAAEVQATSPAESAPPPVQTAVAVPPKTIFRDYGLLIAAAGLLIVAAGLIVLLVRRSRPPEKISLITRSLDRDKK